MMAQLKMRERQARDNVGRNPKNSNILGSNDVEALELLLQLSLFGENGNSLALLCLVMLVELVMLVSMAKTFGMVFGKCGWVDSIQSGRQLCRQLVSLTRGRKRDSEIDLGLQLC